VTCSFPEENSRLFKEFRNSDTEIENNSLPVEWTCNFADPFHAQTTTFNTH